jgi:hypothetical protein
MIGRKVSEMCLNGKELEFYKWEREGQGLTLVHFSAQLKRILWVKGSI